MDWKTIYRPERKADWADIADAIHSAVTMDDVLRLYAPNVRPKNHRCPCPIHSGKDYNFSYTRDGYRCFVCGASGDVITFVKELLRLSTRVDAMKRINVDLRLNLPIDGNISAEVSANLARLRADREAQERRREALENAYHTALDEWIELDKTVRTSDPNSTAYADAVKRIDYASYKLDLVMNGGEQYY